MGRSWAGRGAATRRSRSEAGMETRRRGAIGEGMDRQAYGEQIEGRWSKVGLGGLG
jgi:hypothetical protein